MNSLYQQLNQPQAQQLNNGNDIAQMVKNSADPGKLFQNLAQTNPQVQSIMKMIQTANTTPKNLFYQVAQQRGVDPNQVLGMFK